VNLRRYLAVGIWLALLASCIFIIARSEFNADMSAFLPRSPTPAQKILVDQLRDGVISRLILVGVEDAPILSLTEISKSMAAQLRDNKSFVAIHNGERIGLEKDFELLWKNRYLLSDAVTPQRFSPQGLRDSLNDYLDLLATPMAGMAQRVLPNDPSGELLHLLEQLQGTSQPASQNGVWVSPDGTRAMLLLQTLASGSDIDAQELAVQHIQAAFDNAAKLANASSAHIVMTGPGVFAVQSRASIRDDAARLSLIAMLLVSTMLLLLYRSPRVLFLGVLPVASGALAGIAAVSLGFGAVHGITLGFGVTLIGETIDYAIYLFTQTGHNNTAQGTLQRIWPTLRLGLLTSICGFSVMLFSGFNGLAQLGLFSITGLVTALGTTRWILPKLMPANFSVHTSSRLGQILISAVQFAPRLRFALAIMLIAALSLLWVKRDALWNDNLSSMSPISKELQALDQQLRDDMGAPDVSYMLILTAPDQESVLQQGEVIASILKQQLINGVLDGFDIPPLPSQNVQKMRQAALPDDATLRHNLQTALRNSPFVSGTFNSFPKEISQAKTQTLLDRQALQGSNLGLKLDTLLLQRDASWTLMLPLRGVHDAQRLEHNLRQATDYKFILLDIKKQSENMLKKYRQELASYALLGIISVSLLLLANLRSVRRALEIFLPLLAAVTIVSATLLLSGLALSIFHLIGLLLVVAIGSNYALFFDQRCASIQEHERTLTSLMFANISTVFGFGLLSFSQAQVLSAMGITVALGTFLSLIFSAILIVRKHDKQA
jgi:predicted exporter